MNLLRSFAHSAGPHPVHSMAMADSGRTIGKRDKAPKSPPRGPERRRRVQQTEAQAVIQALRLNYSFDSMHHRPSENPLVKIPVDILPIDAAPYL